MITDQIEEEYASMRSEYLALIQSQPGWNHFSLDRRIAELEGMVMLLSRTMEERPGYIPYAAWDPALICIGYTRNYLVELLRFREVKKIIGISRNLCREVCPFTVRRVSGWFEFLVSFVSEHRGRSRLWIVQIHRPPSWSLPV